MGLVKSVGPQVTKCQIYLTILCYLRASCDLQSVGAMQMYLHNDVLDISMNHVVNERRAHLKYTANRSSCNNNSHRRRQVHTA